MSVRHGWLGMLMALALSAAVFAQDRDLDHAALLERVAELQRVAGQLIDDLLAWQIANESIEYGLHVVGDAGGDAPERLVVVVHGLHDPPWVWRDLMPALLDEGHSVARFEYPSAGAIEHSAVRLDDELKALRGAGTTHVDIVAHSMGGLVTRELLTSPEHYGGDGAGTDERPAIDRFIMVGTPNKGAQLARLRLASDGKWQEAMTGRDDAKPSEAAVQLIPGSGFLERLNKRPRAEHTQYTNIAGRISPVTERQAAALMAQGLLLARSEAAPEWLRDFALEVDLQSAHVLRRAVRGVGDGVVALDATKLDGVTDVVVVEANHISLLVRLVPGDAELPPAIPIVKDRLAR